MHCKKISFAVFALGLGAVSLGQLGVRNVADAYAFDPTHDHEENVYTMNGWHVGDRLTSVTALSESHPWDPPVNVATAWSQFKQPDYKDATVRGRSFVLSDYSGTGMTSGYRATTDLSIEQKLKVTFGQGPIFSFHLYLLVPMHGLMSVRSSSDGSFTSKSSAALYASASGNGQSADTLGIIDMQTNLGTGFTFQIGGDWNSNDVVPANVELPTGDEPRSWDGIEINTNALLDLGICTVNDPNIFDVFYGFSTSAEIETPNGSFALADFNGTGHMNFVAFDSSGTPFNDFTVDPVLDPVPEPISMLALGVGLVALARRRRQASVV